MENDIYQISGRIKNHIAMEDISLSPVGTVLVNYFALAMKDLHDFAYTIPEPYKSELTRILVTKEVVPKHIIQVSTKTQEQEQANRVKPDFDSNEIALDFFLDKYEVLGAKYGMSGDDFWAEAESSYQNTEDHNEIMRLHKNINMLMYLVGKNDR